MAETLIADDDGENDPVLREAQHIVSNELRRALFVPPLGELVLGRDVRAPYRYDMPDVEPRTFRSQGEQPWHS